jgi:hypothetical protein
MLPVKWEVYEEMIWEEARRLYQDVPELTKAS